MKSNAVESLPPPSPHTPGPWTLTVGQTEPTSKGGNVFVRQGPGVYGSFICHVHPRNGESNETEVVYDAEAMANARLIASAPQLAEDLARVTAERDRLREACVNMLSRIEQLQDQWGKEGFTDGTARMIREALKATT